MRPKEAFSRSEHSCVKIVRVDLDDVNPAITKSVAKLSSVAE